MTPPNNRHTVAAAVVVTAMSLLLATSAFHGCEAHAKPCRDVALLLAQSCVGEAGMSAHRTGECAAIWHVYAKRMRLSAKPVSLYRQVLLYSAAVKPRVVRSHRWVRYLGRAGKQPQHWPRGLKWGNHRKNWLATVTLADKWLTGAVADPTPKALHYGGWIDRNRLNKRVWRRIKTPGFGNWFYERRPNK